MSRAIAACVVLLGYAGAVHAAEVDNYYAWLYPPRDETVALDKIINERLAAGLATVNGRRDRAQRSCRDVAREMTLPLLFTAFWYPVGEAHSWRVDMSPRSRSELVGRYARESVYRNNFLPSDPAVRVGDVIFGLDKIGHFFTRGFVYYDQFLAARAHGNDEVDAERAAIMQGFEDERGWLGLDSNNQILSYADLEANYQGLRWYRSLCENTDGTGLSIVRGRWQLDERFSVRRWVTPCWDEVFYPNAYGPRRDGIRTAVKEICQRLSSSEIRRRRDVLARVGCHGLSFELLRDAQPRPWSIDDVCAP